MLNNEDIFNCVTGNVSNKRPTENNITTLAVT